jgi:hypothetical protein
MGVSISLDIETFPGAIMKASYLDVEIVRYPAKEMGHVGPSAVPAVRR